MFQLSTIDYNSCPRKVFPVRGIVIEIKKERHWVNLWLKKTNNFTINVLKEDIPDVEFEDKFGNKLEFPKTIVVHDLENEIENVKGDIVKLKVGYAEKHFQYWENMKAFSITFCSANKEIVLR
jgi:hypothetical protein